ncbi:hypothetical protein Vadar_013775 [Vaccinium darrowii]|uniref:Uncharacterized protein n=1 Tax=Vaccinium darrowii TaxID=229202 RepID=A0ACB7Y6H6_9ERIC|nr:hypothetical protein Vadar_013775 [Vaccinium darrowii]
MVEARNGEEMLKAEEMAAKHRTTGTVPKKLGCFGSVNVIDAKAVSTDPVAVVELTNRVPFGFHAFFSLQRSLSVKLLSYALEMGYPSYEQEELEKKKADYAEKMQNKVALIHKEAEERRAMVEERKGEEMLKAEEMAAKYRATGSVPKNLECFGC